MNPQEECPQETILHNRFQEEMRKEVYLMRELLSNMHQEEVSLMLQDKKSLQEILDTRSSLLEKLGCVRRDKQGVLQALEKSLPHFHRSIEVVSLYDQLSALSEKVHRQFFTNRHLTKHPDRSLLQSEYLHEKTRPSQKTKVITLQIKR